MTNKQTERQTDRHFGANLHPYGKLKKLIFAYGREITNGVKFIPPCCACRGIILQTVGDDQLLEISLQALLTTLSLDLSCDEYYYLMGAI
jgi:hypothetical protein